MIDLKFDNIAIHPCGSRITCNPPELGTDEDYLVFCREGRAQLSRLRDYLANCGWECETNEYSGQEVVFESWRHKHYNLIVTHSPKFYKRHILATKLCTKLNLMDKKDRIAVFQAILYEEA